MDPVWSERNQLFKTDDSLSCSPQLHTELCEPVSQRYIMYINVYILRGRAQTPESALSGTLWPYMFIFVRPQSCLWPFVFYLCWFSLAPSQHGGQCHGSLDRSERPLTATASLCLLQRTESSINLTFFLFRGCCCQLALTGLAMRPCSCQNSPPADGFDTCYISLRKRHSGHTHCYNSVHLKIVLMYMAHFPREWRNFLNLPTLFIPL